MIYKKYFLFFIGIFSLLLGLFFQENSSGGAEYDYNYLLPIIKAFGVDLKQGFNSFLSDAGTVIHSPIFYIISGKLLHLTGSSIYIKIFYIFLSSLLPLIFYQILKQYKKKENIYVFIFSLILFISPYFRSSSIWLLSDNLSLIFFSLSILFYIKHEKTNNFIYCYYCVFFLCLCCYLRYYYFPFYIFYMLVFLKKHNSQNIIKLLIFSFFISLPAFFYFYYVIKYFSFYNYINLNTGHSLRNYPTNFLVVLSISLFYLLPFIPNFFRDLKIYLFKEKKRVSIIFSLFLIFYFLDFFFYQKLIFFGESNYGGGIFKKIFEFLNLNVELSLILIGFLSFVILDYIFKHDRKYNFILFSCLVLSLPFVYLYQKYLDPLFLLILFGLVKSKCLKNILENLKKYISLYYIYFLLFLTSTFIIY